MRVGIDARFITRQPRRGIGNYSLNLVAELVKLSPETEFFLYISEPDVEGLLPNNVNVTIRRLKMPAYPFWEQLALPQAASRDKLNILHCLGNTAPVIIPQSVNLVMSLMDVMFLQSGDFVPKPTNHYQALGRIYRRMVVARCARAADQIITISEFSRADILELVPGLDSSRMHVIHLSCDAAFGTVNSSLEKSLLESGARPYIFALGANDPRKNTLRLVNAYLAILGKGGFDHNLVISGYSDWQHSESYLAVKKAGASDRVRFFSYVSIEELASLYRNATVFVYPSLYEGFGIPLLEAFSSGCPVIASNVTSIPEVGGNAALYVDPLSEQEIGQAMCRVIQEGELRQSLVQLGHARALEFTWEETAKQTLSVYERCMRKAVAP